MQTSRYRAGKKLRQRGASMVEFALVAPVFFFLLFAIIDLCVLFWVNVTMQHAVREGARYAITGQNDLDPSATDKERYQAIIEKIKDSSMGLFDKMHPTINVNGTSYSNPKLYNAAMFGVAGQIVVLQLNCSWPLMTPLVRPFFADGNYSFSVAATMRNEDYK